MKIEFANDTITAQSYFSNTAEDQRQQEEKTLQTIIDDFDGGVMQFRKTKIGHHC